MQNEDQSGARSGDHAQMSELADDEAASVVQMEHVTGAPSRWTVVLQDGSKVTVWADSVTGLTGDDDVRDYVFDCLMDVNLELQERIEVTGRTPTNPCRVLVEVAHFPRAAVRDVYSS